MQQHELDTANRLTDLGEDVTFIPSGNDPRPDAYLSDGRPYEFKSPTRANRNTILTDIRQATRNSKEYFVLDLSRSPMPLDQAIALARYAVDNYAGIKQIRLIGRQTSSGPLDVTMKKIGG